jgi:splicing factor 3A subunit 1
MSEEPAALAHAPEGVVLPPKDIRTIVERTAGYVARNGRPFEDRIREQQAANHKFSFLNPNDAYAAFYQWRLEEIKDGRGTTVAAGPVGDSGASKEPEKAKGPAQPPEFHFSARMPNISALDLEVVKLTALFVAKNGRSFMTTLSQKEARNFQFDFLRPQHSLYSYFSRLVDQYTDLIQAATVEGGKLQEARKREVRTSATDKFYILGKAKSRAEWVKWQQQQRQKRQEEEEKERIEFQQIDWQDFVVVESVLFTEADDQQDLPPPTSLNDLQSASLEQKAAMSLQPAHMRIEEAMPTEDMYMGYGQPPPSMPAYGMPAPALHANGYQPSPPPPTYAQQNDDEMRAIAERNAERERAAAAQAAAKGAPGQPMRIRNDYVPRAQAKRQNVPMSICPNCHQQIPDAEMNEHLRVESLDPRWKEQQQKAQSRTANQGAIDVGALKRQHHEAASAGQAPLSTEEEARRKRAAPAGEPVNVNDQLRSLRERYGQ